MQDELMDFGSATNAASKAQGSYVFSLATCSSPTSQMPIIQVYMPAATTDLLSLDAHTANWVIKAVKKIESLAKLQRNWNSYDGLPLSRNARRTTFDALECLKRQDLPVPAVVLGSGGTVHLEWRSDGKELEFGFGDHGMSEYLKVDSLGHCDEEEGPDEEIRKKLTALAEWLKNG